MENCRDRPKADATQLMMQLFDPRYVAMGAPFESLDGCWDYFDRCDGFNAVLG